jgi:hypothetical protein
LRLITAQLLSHFVKKSGFTYDTAVNGFKALQAFQVAEKPYDIVIMGTSPPVQPIYFLISGALTKESRHHNASHGWDTGHARNQEVGTC